MSAAGKMSRNQQRKAAYAALADKSSRNQVAIEAPIVGHFETRAVTEPCPRCADDGFPFGREDCKRCKGTGRIEKRDRSGKVQTVEVIVHDKPSAEATVTATKKQREIDPRKRRRQIGAWTRCRALRTTGAHRGDGNNCQCCGCPRSEQGMRREVA